MVVFKQNVEDCYLILVVHLSGILSYETCYEAVRGVLVHNVFLRSAVCGHCLRLDRELTSDMIIGLTISWNKGLYRRHEQKGKQGTEYAHHYLASITRNHRHE